MSIEHIAIAYTGGIDSTVLAYYLCRNWRRLHSNPNLPLSLHLLIADYGQANCSKSWELAAVHCERLKASGLIHNYIRYSVPCPIPGANQTGLTKENYIPPSTSPNIIDYAKQERPYDYAHIEGRNAHIFLNLMACCKDIPVDVLYTGYQYEPAEWENLDSYRHRVCDAGPNLTDRMNVLQEVGFTRRVRIENPFITLQMSKLDIVKRGIRYGINIEEDTYSCQFYPKCEKCENCVNVRLTMEKLKEGN